MTEGVLEMVATFGLLGLMGSLHCLDPCPLVVPCVLGGPPRDVVLSSLVGPGVSVVLCHRNIAIFQEGGGPLAAVVLAVIRPLHLFGGGGGSSRRCHWSILYITCQLFRSYYWELLF